jgi:isoleucyl-tRNA synthetase
VEELEEFFILSSLELRAGDVDRAEIAASTDRKCSRCWRHRRSVGLTVAHPELCERCAGVVA